MWDSDPSDGMEVVSKPRRVSESRRLFHKQGWEVDSRRLEIGYLNCRRLID